MTSSIKENTSKNAKFEGILQFFVWYFLKI